MTSNNQRFVNRIEKKKTQELISYDHSVWKDIKKELFSNKIATGEYHYSR